MKIDNYHSRALIAWTAATVLAVGLMVLVGMKPAWTADRSFESAPNSPFSVGSTPTTVTSADFDADGKMDLAAQNAGSNNVSVRLGNGDGSFQAKQDYAMGSVPTSVISADFNADNLADLAVSNQNSGSVSVLLGEDRNGDGKGDGTFKAKQDFPVGPLPTSVISADFNSDGIVDLAAATNATTPEQEQGKSAQVSILLGQDSNGDGKGDGFKTPQRFSIAPDCPGTLCPLTTMSNPNQIITADFNGDNKPDLATANFGSIDPIFGTFNNPGGVSVLMGNGNGTFQLPKEAMKGSGLAVSSIAAARLDTGASVDLVATRYLDRDPNTEQIVNGRSVSVLSGNGDGTFRAIQNLGVGLNPSAVTSADLDGDAKADDLAVSNYGSNDVSVLFNNDNGSFQAAQNFPAGIGPIFVVGADFNTDSFTDLAVANQDSNNVSVLLNTAPRLETTIISGPSEGKVVNSTSATFGFTSSEPGSTFQCSLDDSNDAAFSPCTSPKTVPNEGQLADGTHTFYVRATGTAGTDLTPAARTWKVDTTAPDTNITAKPDDPSNNASPSFSFASDEANSTFECKLDNDSYTSCPSSGKSYSGLGEGSHTFSVRSIDGVSNVDGTPSSYTWTVDTTKPTVIGTTPLSRATGVGRGTNLTATFSEKIRTSTVNTTTFKLYRLNADGTQTRITNVTISLSPDRLKATLNPFGAQTPTLLLARNTKYKGVLTTGAKDLAGNPLAQQKSWTFTTKP